MAPMAPMAPVAAAEGAGVAEASAAEELAAARYQGQRIAETAAKLAG